MNRDLHAAVVGINAYGEGITPLLTAGGDAQAVAQTLEHNHGYSVDLLLDADADLLGLEDLLEDTLRARVEEDTALLIYFAGHGVALGEGVDELRGFLLPQDSKAGDESSWLSMESFRAALDALPCRHLLVVLDCCFGGSFRWASSTRSIGFGGRPLYDSQYERYLKGMVWQVLTSASHNEKAQDVMPGRSNPRDAEAEADGDSVAEGDHSPFAAALLRGLAGAADSARAGYEPDGVITATELKQYVFEELVPRQGKSLQTPGLWPLKPEATGEYVFQNPEAEKNTRPDPTLDDGNNPWLGLEAYDENDAPLFFGRDRVTLDLLGLLTGDDAPPLVAVVGASGTGKSSVVKAGVLPRLGKPPEKRAPEKRTTEIGAWTVECLPRLQGDPRGILETAAARLAEAPAGHGRLLFIDQFEELYTQCPDRDAREAFLERLRQLATGEAASEAIRVLLTVRSDFEPRFKASPAIAGLVARGRYVVPAFNSQELRQIVEEPAKLKAIYFEPEALVDTLVDEVMAMPGGLPLLSFALAEMYRQAWLRRRDMGASDRALTRDDYQAAGGVVGALHRRATELYEQADVEHQATIRRIFLRMISQEGGRLARRRVADRELEFAAPGDPEQQRVDSVLGRTRREDRPATTPDYVGARLLVAGEGHVEPAHDTLVLAWDKLLEWLSRPGSQDLRRQVWRAATEWHEACGKGSEKSARGLLWTEDPRLPQLADLSGWSGRWRARFGDRASSQRLARARERVDEARRQSNLLEQRFVDASAADRRRRRNWRTATLAAVMAFLVAASVFSLHQAQQAAESAKQADESARDARDQRDEANKQSQIARNKKSDAEDAAFASVIDRALAEQERDRADGERTRAERQAVIANSGRLANAALLNLADPARLDLASLLAIEAKNAADSFESRHALLSSVQSSPRLQTFLHNHQATVVHNIAFSPKGKLLASSNRSGTVSLWNVESGKRLSEQNFGNSKQWVWSIAFSPEGILAAGRDQNPSQSERATVFLWDGATQEQAGPIPYRQALPLAGYGSTVMSVAFSPDGKNLAVGYWGGVQLCGIKNSEEQRTVDPTDGEDLALGSHRLCESMWASKLGQKSKATTSCSQFAACTRLPSSSGKVWSVAFSHDSKTLASAGTKLQLWDVANRKESPKGVLERCDARRWHLDPPIGPIWQIFEGRASVAFSPAATRENILAWPSDTTVQLLNVKTNAPFGELKGHSEKVKSVAFSRDGKTLASSDAKTVRLWNIDEKRQIGEPLTGDRVLNVAFSPDGKTLASAGHDGRVWLRDVEGRPPLGVQIGGDVRSIAFSPTEDRLAAAGKDTVWLWDVEGRPSLEEPSVARAAEKLPHGAGIEVQSVAFSPDGKLLASASHATVWLWDVDSPEKPLDKQTTDGGPVGSVAFSPNGTTLASASGDQVRLWNVAGSRLGSGKKLSERYEVIDLAFSHPDGALLALPLSDTPTGDNWSLQLLDLDDPDKPRVLKNDLGRRSGSGSWWKDKRVSAAAFSMDEKSLALIRIRDGSKLLEVWNIEPPKLRGERLIDLATDKTVRSVAFSQDGKVLASTSHDQTVRLFEVKSLQPLGLPLQHHHAISKVAFSRDGKILASLAGDTVWLWDLDPESWVERACRRANRNLSLGEWRRHLGPDVPYRHTCPDLPPGEGVEESS